MEIYDNERDQLDALKQFFIKYGKTIAVIIAIVAAVIFFWHDRNDSQAENARNSSLAYENISEKLTTGDKQAISSAEKFATDNQSSYGVLTSLKLAQQFIADQQPEKAAMQLQQALGKTKDDNLRALITLRLARIQIQQKQPDVALNTLDAIKINGWSALIADLRGDALLSKGDKQGARDAWSHALQNPLPSDLRNILQMKINNLSV